MPLIQMNEDFTWPFSDGGFEGGAGHREHGRPRYRLQKFATDFRRVAPDFNSVRCIRRLGSAAAAAFPDRVADVGAIAHKIDAAAVFHSVRSYWGRQPRPMPFDIRLLAMKS